MACGFLALASSLGASSLRAQEGRKVITNPTPVYPEIAKRMHLSGSVKVEVTIAPDGKIKEIKVIGGHPLLVASVEDTLKNWKYAQSKEETTTMLEFNFHP